MPVAQIDMQEGPTEEQKLRVRNKVAEALQQATVEAGGCVTVWITEVPKANRGIAGKTASEHKR